MSMQLIEQEKWCVRLDDKLNYMVEHAKKVSESLNTNQLAVIELQKDMVHNIALTERLPIIERRIDHAESLLMSGDTTAGKIATNAIEKAELVSKVAESLQRWRSYMSGTISIAGAFIGVGIVILAVIIDHTLSILTTILRQMPMK